VDLLEDIACLGSRLGFGRKLGPMSDVDLPSFFDSHQSASGVGRVVTLVVPAVTITGGREYIYLKGVEFAKANC